MFIKVSLLKMSSALIERTLMSLPSLSSLFCGKIANRLLSLRRSTIMNWDWNLYVYVVTTHWKKLLRGITTSSFYMLTFGCWSG